MHSQLEDSAMSYCPPGAAPRFWKWGGDNFVSGASKKIFLIPPLFGQWGGQNIAEIAKSA